jgi:hypothetical protein
MPSVHASGAAVMDNLDVARAALAGLD